MKRKEPQKNAPVNRRDFFKLSSETVIGASVMATALRPAALAAASQSIGLGIGAGSLRGLVYPRQCRRRRISSWDREGKNRDRLVIGKGASVEIANIQGAGCISHIWVTISCEDTLYPRKTLLRMYWDGEKTPSVESPIGDFFGVGHGRVAHYMSLPLNMVTGGQPLATNRAAMNCFFPMPFAEGARIEVLNECDSDIRAFYYYIDYEEYPSLPQDALRFHAQWRRENPTRGPINLKEPGWTWAKVDDQANLDGKYNYLILEAEGRGHYVGCVLNIDHINPIPRSTWFGEGDDMIFIDGEATPSLVGTGTEDYFCAAWGFPSGKYDGPYHGISLAGPTEGPFGYSGKWTVYRFHIEDPITFNKSIKVTIEHGHANAHANDYSSVAYWYQTEPHKPFPTMLPVEKRLPIPDRESMKLYAESILSS